MKKFFQVLVALVLTSLFIFPSFASFVQNENDGYFIVDFLNSEQGLAANLVPFRENVSIDTNAGTANLLTSPGYVTTAEIRPTSFSAWDEVEVSFTANDPADLTVSLVECDGAATPIAGYQNITPTSGVVDISALSTATDCFQVKVNLQDTDGIKPVLNSVQATWLPLPVYLIGLSGDTIKDVGEVITYTINYSVSYVDDQDVVVWIELPNDTNAGSITLEDEDYSSLSFDTNSSFVSATAGGTFTASADVIDGISIPANSVYWQLGDVPAGKAGTLSLSIKAPNGVENNLSYHVQAHINSTSESVQANSDSDLMTAGEQSFTTALNAEPDPTFEKKQIGTISVNNNPTVFNGAGVNGIVTYLLILKNQYKSTGRETIFNPVIDDDLSDIFNKLMAAVDAGCAIATENDVEQRITVNGNTLDTLPAGSVSWDLASKTLSFDLEHVPPAGVDQVEFSVDYNDCLGAIADGSVIDNTATVSADNIAPISDDQSVYFGIDPTPTGSFAKGDKVAGSYEIHALRDDNDDLLQYYGDTFSYLLATRNISAVRLDDHILVDKIPAGTKLSAVSVPASMNATVFYATDTSYTDPNTPPPFDYTSAPADLDSGANTIWDSTPPANIEDTTWIAIYVPCVSSLIFPSPVASECENVPGSFVAEIITTVLSPGEAGFPGGADQCYQFDTENIAHFYVFEAASNINNDDGDVVALATEIHVTDTEETHVSSRIGSFSASSEQSEITGPASIDTLESGTYIVTVRNVGADTAFNAVVDISVPVVNANGGQLYLPVNSASGGTINYVTNTSGTISGTYESVEIDIGNLAPGAEKEVEITFTVPKGIINGTNYTVQAQITAEDDNACAQITDTLDFATAINSIPLIVEFKEVDEALVESGNPATTDGEIHYQISFFNSGDAPTTSTYIVDRMPGNVRFKEAYTSPAVDSNSNTFNCTACSVYFAKDSIDLPSGLSPLDPISEDDINNYFVLGEETVVGSGVWLPPATYASPEEIVWVAWRVDDTSLTPPLFPVGASGKVGLLVQNDDDGAGPGATGSLDGTLIRNSSAVFSAELLQAIGNQVVTTILPSPGLNVAKSSSKDVVALNEDFDWNVSYFNDSQTDNTDVTVTDTLPLGIQLVGLYHTWNAQTNSNDGSLPVGEVDIISNAAVSVTANPNGTTTVEIKIADSATPANGLRGAALSLVEGGQFRFAVRATSPLQTGSTPLNEAVGCYDNGMTEQCVSDTDIVRIENPDLFIRKLVDIKDPLPGETVTYTLLVSNEGTHFAPDVLIQDTLPAGLCYVGPTTVVTPDWSVSEPSVSVGDCSSVSTSLTWSDLSHPSYLPAGTVPATSGDIVITYKAQVDAGVAKGTNLKNTVSVSTTLVEDPDFDNESEQDVQTPLPNPYVTKTAQTIVLPGDSFSYGVNYGNATREATINAYLIDTLPNVRLQSVVAGNGETVYCHDGSLGAPTFPFTAGNGWVPVADCFNPGYFATHVGAFIGNLPAESGPFTITLTVSAVDRLTGNNLSSGVTLTNNVSIFADEDGDPTDSQDSVDTKIPGADLFITKTGSEEGSFPGITPGSALSYDIEFGNSGTSEVCSVFVHDILPAELTVLSPTDDFLLLELSDATGASILPVDLAGDDITTPVSIVKNQISANEIRWQIGDPYTDVCIPAGARASFTIFTEVKQDVADGTIINNTITIGEDSAAIEDILENNSDDSSVTVYLADVTTTKEGFSCGESGDCTNTTDNDYTFANPGEYIQYDLTYNNLGNISAENVAITEIIPENTCYRIGTVEASQPLGTTLEYSNDSGLSWAYIPIADAMGLDCNVSNFRLLFDSAMPAPATFWSQTTKDQFDSATLLNTVAVNGENNSGQVQLATGDTVLSDLTATEGVATGVISKITNTGKKKIAWAELSATAAESYDVYFWSDDYPAGSPLLLSDLTETEGVASINSTHGMQLDSNQNAHIVWRELVSGSESYDIFYWDEASASTKVLSDRVSTEGQANLISYEIDASDNIHIVWTEFSATAGEQNDVYYWNSTMPVGSPTLVSNHALSQGTTSTVYAKLNNGVMHVSFSEYTGATESYDVFYWNSTFLTPAVVLSDILLTSGFGVPVSFKFDSNGNIHLIFREYVDINEREDIFYWNSGELPSTFPTRLSDTSSTQGTATAQNFNVATSIDSIYIDPADNVHIVWQEISATAGESHDVYYWKTGDAAGSPTLISDLAATQGTSQVPRLTSAGGVIYVFWNEISSIAAENYDIYLWDNATTNTQILSDLTATEGYAYFPFATSAYVDHNGVLHLIFNELVDGQGYDLFYWNTSLAVGDLENLSTRTEQTGYSNNAAVTVDAQGVVHVVWSETVSLTEQRADVFYWNSLMPADFSKNLTAGQVELPAATFTFLNLQFVNFKIHIDSTLTPHIVFYSYFWASDGVTFYNSSHSYYWSERCGADPATELHPHPYGDTNFTFTDFNNTFLLDGDQIYLAVVGSDLDTATEGSNMYLFPGLPASGSITTDTISNTFSGNLTSWGKLFFDVDIPDGADINFDILDLTDTPISGFTELYDSGGTIDLSSLDVATYPEIKLRANFTPSDAYACEATPTLEEWTVTYYTDQVPGFGFEVKVIDDPVSFTIDNNVEISTSTPETDDTNNNDADSLALEIANLNITKSVDLAAAQPGNTLTYTLEFCNEGPQTAVTPVVTDTLPANVTLVNGDGCDTGSLPTIICNESDLAPGECGSHIFTVTVDGGTPNGTNLTNSVCIDSSTVDSDPLDNCDNASTIVEQLANVYITKSGPSFTNINGLITYTLEYGNNGNNPAADVFIVDSIDTSAVTFVSVSQTAGAIVLVCAEAPTNPVGKVVCSLDGSMDIGQGATLPSGETGTIEIQVRVNNDSDLVVNNYVIPNFVTIDTSSAETDFSDNDDFHDVPVVQGALADISGRVFVDRDTDVEFDTGVDSAISDVDVYLYGYDIFGNVYGPPAGSVEFSNVITQTWIDDVLVTAGVVPAGTTVASLTSLSNYITISEQTTDTAGAYTFNGLNMGLYNVYEAQPLGYYSTGSNGGQENATIDDTNVADSTNPGHGIGTRAGEGGTDVNRITSIWLNEGMLSSENNFAENLGSIGDIIWYDSDGSGDINLGELGIEGVEVSLYKDTDGNASLDTGVDSLESILFTDVNGNYLFSDLAVSDVGGDVTYFVVVSDSADTLVTFEHTVGVPNTDNNSQDETGYLVTLSESSPQDLTADFGYLETASLGNKVWWDLNQDGLQDASEVGIAGVTVELYDSANNLIDTLTTDGNGEYLFDLLTPGDYYLKFIPPDTAAYLFTNADVGSDDNFDSDANVATGISQTFTLTPGDNNLSLDAGLYVEGIEPASVGDFVWYDSLANNVQDGGETGVPGVSVELYKADGTLFSTTVTDGDGLYSFDGLAPGDYYIEFKPDSGYDFIAQNSGTDDEVDSDADVTNGRVPNFTLASGDSNNSIDAGLVAPAGVVSLGDFVWYDESGEGVQDLGETGVPGVTVNLYKSDGTLFGSQITDVDGGYLFSNLLPGDYYVEFLPQDEYSFTPANIGDEDKDSDVNVLTNKTDVFTLSVGVDNLDIDAGLVMAGNDPAHLGNFVWHDYNANGIQDAGEPGIGGVEVNLYNGDGTFVTTTLTNGTGVYTFNNLVPGDYIVEFIIPSSNYSISPNGAGADASLDSDLLSTGRTESITLASGENNPDIDAAFYESGSVGNQVFIDVDGDGTFGSEDQGLSGVELSIYKDLNRDGVFDAGDTLFATTVSGADGQYLFEDLPLEDGTGSCMYVVVVSQPADFNSVLGTPNVDGDGQDPNGFSVEIDGLNPNHTGADFGFTFDGGPWRCLSDDIDADGILNSEDSDIDGDGILNTVEAQDAIDSHAGNDDIDNDGLINSFDLDSDGDGIPDSIEGQTTYSCEVETGNDRDGDGLDDNFDPDGPGLLSITPVDTDGDGIPDYLDLDSDGDGLSDSEESYNQVSVNVDLNCDGIDDAFQPDTMGCHEDPDDLPGFRDTPLECTDSSTEPSSLTMDGIANQILKLGKVVVKSRRKLQTRGVCGNKYSKKKLNKFNNQFIDYYNSIWQQAWDMPGMYYPCEDYLPGNCTIYDISGNKQAIKDSAKNSLRLTNKIFRNCENVKRVRRTTKRIKQLKKGLNKVSNDLPSELASCLR